MAAVEADRTVKPENEGNWSDVLTDPLALLTTFQQNIGMFFIVMLVFLVASICHNTVLADVDGKDESKIVIGVSPPAGGPSSIQLLTGGTVVKKMPFASTISGLVALYQDPEARLPVIAVSSGDSVFAFKNLNPFHKYTLPPLEVDEMEREIWVNVRHDEDLDHDALAHTLQELSLGHPLTPRSYEYLAKDPSERAEYVELIKDLPITKHAVITTMTTIHKNVVDEKAPACVVLGTDHGAVVVLNPSNFAVLLTVKVQGSVAAISCAGAFEVDHRILVTTRNNRIYTIKGGQVAETVLESPSIIIGCGRVLRTILVVCKNQSVYAYNTKGKRLWQSKLPSEPTAVAPFTYKPKLIRGLLVGMRDGTIHLYNDTTLLDVISTDFPVSAITFGHVWRGSYVLAAVGHGGELTLKRVVKGAEFEPRKVAQGAPPEQNIRINVPSKTQLYVDQTQRERDNAIAMHRAFQRDLYMMQLNIARNFVQAINKSMAPEIKTQDVQLQVGAHVQGIGPRFKLTVTIQNISRKMAENLRIAFHCDVSMYEVEDPILTLSAAAPGVTYRKSTFVQFLLDEELVSSPITAHVFLPPAIRPVVTAIIDMPIAEPIINVR
eukprot:TRINITY_DN9416_c0_g1_i5.p1 TRINITY_DN9416_c0_g1~~TRINITY_DN9416_c0_g1_i5.p1  ORF type:complete len:606 (+),score=153.65 TRINITY_DN9416_c0_g1_i5:125-1942(+)